MPRPVKQRFVQSLPRVNFFRPVGVPRAQWREVTLSIEEAEAIRLKDLEGLGQEVSAQRMRVSRPTFQRVLESGRKKMAEALIEGKAIRVEGGNFEVAMRRFRCEDDGQEWEVPRETVGPGWRLACPHCNSTNVRLVFPPDSGVREQMRGGRRRRGWP